MVNRRKFIGSSVLAGSIAMAAPAPDTPVQNTAPPKEVTCHRRILLRDISDDISARAEDVPACGFAKKAARTLSELSMGCSIGAAQNAGVMAAVSAMSPFFGPKQASLLGRKEKADIFNAAQINGISAHILDFDDAHLRTIIHPAAPVVPAILALAEYRHVSGKDFLHALVLGIETECRIGNAVYPPRITTPAVAHHAGTTGVFGAAAACEQDCWGFPEACRWSGLSVSRRRSR